MPARKVKKKSAANRRKLRELLRQFLKREDFKFQQLPNTDIFMMNFGGDTTTYQALFHIMEDRGLILFYVFGPTKVPLKRLHAAAEFVARANFGLQVGNLELDFRDGEVRYKSTLVVEGATVGRATLLRFMLPALFSMDEYYPGILRVALGSLSPAAAIAEIESATDGRSSKKPGSRTSRHSATRT